MANPPNILLIVSDDHGYGDLGFKGQCPDVQTPNLDRLAHTGMSFDTAYVSAPICSPSRAGMITGAYQERWGAQWFYNSKFAPTSYNTIPEVMHTAGYRTGYFGKIHYGTDDNYGHRSCPDQHGFDEAFYGIASLSMGRLHYMHHGDEWVEKMGEDYNNAHGVNPMVHNGEKVSCNEHLTGEFARRAIDFMGDPAASDESAQPFFCMVAFNAVHNFTWQLPKYKLDEKGLPMHPDFDPSASKYVDWYDGCVEPNLDNGRGYYLGQLELMDTAVGRMLDHLEATGQRENTLVIYLTDNGGSACNYGDNSPLMGRKYTLYEGGVRVPFIASQPGTIPEGTTSNALISALDLMPTFAAVGGATLPDQPVDGIDLSKVFRGEETTAHKELYFDNAFQWAVVTPKYKLRWSDGSSKYAATLQRVEHTDIGDGLMLTDLENSFDESPAANLADAHPEVVEELKSKFDAWKATMGADA